MISAICFVKDGRKLSNDVGLQKVGIAFGEIEEYSTRFSWFHVGLSNNL